jgi:hypothetical protein
MKNVFDTINEAEKNIKASDIDVAHLPTVISELDEIRQAIQKVEKEKTYYLFGYDAMKEMEQNDENPIEEIIELFEDGEIHCDTFIFIEGETSSSDLLEALLPHSGYSIVTKEEYDKLSEVI